MNEDRDIVDALKEAARESGAEVLEGKEAVDFMESEMNKPENVKARKENASAQDKRLAEFFAKDHKYKWQKGMGEISGFGGSYEKGCRAMLIAGLEYWDANPDLDPQYKGWEGVYGILSDNNEDAKKLDDVVMDVVNRDCTGAMHQAVVSSILYIKKQGWDKYVEDMSKPKEAERN